MAVVVVGSINTDLTIRVPRFPAAHETVLGLGDYQVFYGGKGANQAAAAAAAGARVEMIGRVGEDDFGRRSVESLVGAGVGCAHVSAIAGCASGLAAILVDEGGANSIVVASGANARVTPQDIQAAAPAFDAARILMLQLETPLPAVRAAIEVARARGLKIILNPAPAPREPLGSLDGIYCVTPNEIEAGVLTGVTLGSEADLNKACDALLAQGAANVIITLGARGCFIANAETRAMIPSYAVNAVDTTGAGDTFSGYLAAALADGASLAEAAKIACAAAALAVTRPGARTHMLTKAEVERFMLENKPNA